MGVFTCPKCRKLRNEFDKLQQGMCRMCGGGGVVRPPVQGAPKITKYPCANCEKWCGPSEGQMFRNGVVFCHLCLNTGAYLDYYRRHGVKTTLEHYKPGKKPSAHFGKG